MAYTIPPLHIPFTPGSNSLLDALRPGAPRPFSSSPASSIPVFCFGVLMYYFSVCFYVFWIFFAVSADLLCAGFAALHPLPSFFRAPTMTSFHSALLCTGSTYTRSVSFPVFLFACIQFCCFSFPCISFVICL
jgi:hypothetical protein